MLRTASATILAALIGLSGIAPASTMPFAPARPAIAPATNIENAMPLVEVRHRRGFHRHRNHGWYHGHRGYRHHRHGYRYYNGFWFPPAAFALGAIISSGPSRVVRPGYMNPNHIAWCHDRYRSYREYDNSWQPYEGSRRKCRSPYY